MAASFLVGVLPHKSLKGMGRLEDANHCQALTTGSLKEMLEYAWPDDAHFCCYYVPGETQWPRLNKSVLGALQNAGYPPCSHFFAIDFDNPGHAPMDEAHFYKWLEQVQSLTGVASKWCCHYTTKHGARLVYVFDNPVHVQHCEDLVKGLQVELQRQGLEPDVAASDWTRLFRAPRVQRDGFRSEGDPWFFMEWQDETASLEGLSQAGVASSPQAAGIAPHDHSELPEYHVVRGLLETFNGERAVQSEWYKWAKKRMRGRSCFDAVFGSAMMAHQGSRDMTMLKYVGEATSMLYGHFDTTPYHIYALFIDAASELDSDQDWLSILWSMVTRIWQTEAEKAEVAKTLNEDMQLNTGDKLSAIAAGMNDWCPQAALAGVAPEIRQDIIKRHSIAAIGPYYCIMRQDGRYEKMFVTAPMLISRIIGAGMSDVIEVYTYTKDGERRTKSSTQIINEYSTPVGAARKVPQIAGGYIKDLGTDHAVLVLPAYRRSELITPVYNEEVDTWLQLLAGADHYENLLKWIAFALSFEDGPMCAMSIAGPPGAGKKMLAEGLAECLEEPILATGADLVGKYQQGLLESPFLLVNENWPVRREQEISAMFRTLTGGDTLTIDEKHKPLVRANNPVRILLTANNDEMVQELSGGKDLSPEDRHAIADRLYHFKNNNDAGDYLNTLGGRDYTGRKGNRWIRGDGTGESDHVVAKHFMWLYTTRRRFKKDIRFIMQGNVAQHTDLMHRMLTSSGTTPSVVETLLLMVESDNNPRGVVVNEGGMWVLAVAISDVYHTHLSERTGYKLGMKVIDKVLRNLVESATVPMTMPGHEAEGAHLWHKIDLNVLLKEAEKYGHKCGKLRKLIAEKGGQ